jgi:hypothetical protein
MTIRHGYRQSNGWHWSRAHSYPDSGPAVADASVSDSNTGSGGGTLTLNRCTVTANQVEATSRVEGNALAESKDSNATATATAEASADAYGGGIANFGTLIINQTTVSGNLASATSDAEAHTTASSEWGGATLTQTPVAQAEANAHAGIYNAGTMTVVNSTVSGNEGSADSDAWADNDYDPTVPFLADMNVHAAGSRGPGGEALGRSLVGSGDDWTRTEWTCGPDGECVEARDEAWQPGSRAAPGLVRLLPWSLLTPTSPRPPPTRRGASTTRRRRLGSTTPTQATRRWRPCGTAPSSTTRARHPPVRSLF